MQQWLLIMRGGLMLWLQRLPLTGRSALFTAIALVALPTAVRAAVHGVITGCEFTPYLAFVFLGALLLRWWIAAGVALASVAILGGFFVTPVHQTACFISSAAMFLGSSVAIVGIVIALRGIIAAMQRRGTGNSTNGIVFSLRDGEVWASWYGEPVPLRLGSRRKVSEMMKDFLEQEALGERLIRRYSGESGL
jgi:hypothetical protein